MTEDRGDFLQRLRAEPSADFLARLKARLDAQPSATPAPVVRERPLAGPRSQSSAAGLSAQWRARPLWAVARVLLLAVALTFVPWPAHGPDRTAPVAALGSRAAALALGPDRSKGLVETAALVPAAPQPQAQSRPQAVLASSVRRAVSGLAQPRPARGSQPGSQPAEPSEDLTLVAASALIPYVQDLPLPLRVEHGPDVAPGMRIEAGPADSSAQVCATAGPQDPVPRESAVRGCRSDGLETTLIGHEVAYLARSARAGALPLTAREVFLALARQVPDPSHPQILVANPYLLWSDINPGLPSDPIRVLGPPQASEPGRALLAVLLQSGCRRVLPQATGEQCQAVRSDDVYVEVPDYAVELVRALEGHPAWVGLLSFELLDGHRGELAVSPLNDVLPNAASVLSGAYPAARSLYLYVRKSDLASRPVLRNVVLRYRQLLAAGAVGGPDAALVSSAELESRLPAP